MKEYILNQNWELYGFHSDENRTIADIEAEMISPENQKYHYAVKNFPAQVHDVLLKAKVIENPNITGQNKDLWIDDMDWCYVCNFSVKDPDLESVLELQGLDTFADIYLNGKREMICDDVYLYYQMPVTGKLKNENRLIIYFHSAKKRVEATKIPKKYGGKVPPFSTLRVFRSGFHDFNGPIPTLIRCGVYGEILLHQRQTVMFESVKMEALLDHGMGVVRVETDLKGNFIGEKLSLSLYDMDEKLVAKSEKDISGSEEKIEVRLPSPRLWWPRSHGNPYCYKAEVSCGDGRGHQIRKQIGFRTIELAGDFDYRVNGKPLKLWGANLVHPDTLSNCYQRDRMNHLLDLAVLGNYNILRVWGESEIYPEEFYDECDKKGILIWQDFYLCYSMYSEEPDFLERCQREAEQLVKRLRHHPCLLLWCGGNEMLLSRDYDYPKEECFGEKIIKEVYSDVCGRLDPYRYYHVSSPYGGDWANDPSAGDTHGYTHLWFVPGRSFPVFLSENCRVSTPPMRTMKRMMTDEELWPKEYSGKMTRRYRLKWPETWNRHNTNLGYYKLGPVENYFDADTSEELIYRIGAAHAEYIKRDVQRFRRGYSAEGLSNDRKTKGHMLWKMNNNSNIISYGIVDYFLETYYPFYELKRCYAPLLLSMEFADKGYVWLTNDTQESFCGKILVRMFHLEKNAFVDSFEVAFSILPDESKPICTLDPFQQFKKGLLVCAQAFSSQGEKLAECIDTVEIERNMQYPEDTGISMRLEGDELFIRTQRFARCIEILGNADGDEFGWLFSDNYFDLLPEEEKSVKIIKSSHRKGKISAKGIYASDSTSVDYSES